MRKGKTKVEKRNEKKRKEKNERNHKQKSINMYVYTL